MLASRQSTTKRKVAKGITFPAPTNGWYVGANLAEAPPMTAYLMENFFPQQDYVRIRRGSVEYATGLGGTVSKLFTYEAGVTKKLFACTSTAIWNVTGGGAIGASDYVVTNADWQFVQFTTTGGTYIRGVNGADTPLLYDGATWATTPAITGVTDTNLSAVWSFKNRLYFIEKNTLNAWYLPVDSIGGAASRLALGGVFPLGGNLIAGATWAISSNSGLYETCVFITDKGEVAMYDGDYPGATGWTLKGLYQVGRPLGRDCLMKAGGDLLIVTEDGIVPMSKVMTLDRIALANEAITKPIQPAWREAVINRTGLSGWSITIWPLESMAVICLPQIDSNNREQFVANVRSGAWCRYTGWDAFSFAVLDNRLYFGTSDGRVMRGETGGNDDGSLYTAKLIYSWEAFKQGANRKQVKAIRPVYRATFNVAPSLEVLADYNTSTRPAPAASANTITGAVWGTAIWGVDVWPGTVFQKSDTWQSANGFGVVLAPVIQISVSSDSTPDFRLQQMDVLFETGGSLG